ncbi:MAG: hypothetical protein C4529_05830 [Deltaproteobacteria bacterium]|nr:MAG: hypothetical protein C4529_05830 [Deltaproteobacteria bacterium]
MNRIAGFPSKWVAGLAALALVLLFSAPSRAAEAPRMTAVELSAALGSPDLAVIDVRVDAAVAETKIPGAAVEDPRDVAAWASKYPKGKTIVLYCS